LREFTKEQWERTPASGALEHTKGDLYIPNEKQVFLIEVKNYKDPAIAPGMLGGKSNNLKLWWKKIAAQAFGAKITPVLFFKHDRSKWYIAVPWKPEKVKEYLYVGALDCYVMLADEYLSLEGKVFNEKKLNLGQPA
jgi:Holliday junction resolvase